MKNGNRKRIDVVALFLPEIKELLQVKNFLGLKAFLKSVNSMDLAEGWRHLEPTDRIIVFKLLGTKKSIEVFENLQFSEQNYLLNNLDNADAAQVINEMAPDERADLFKELPTKAVRKLFSLVRKEEVSNIRSLITYKEGTAGSLMTTDFVVLKKDMTARQAILSVQENLRADYRENVYSLFVVDETRKITGSISLQDLLKAPPDIAIKDIMSGVDLIKIVADTDIKEAAAWFKKYDLLDAPVVDRTGVLVGIITVDDIMEILEKAVTSELYEIGKMSPEGGEIISYARANTYDLVRRRAGWLVLLLIFDFLTGTVLKNYEHLLSSVVALAFFIPMLLDTGGNAGAQTSITIIRGFATGDVTFKNLWKVARLEFSAAFFMSIIIGSVAFGRAFLLQKDYSLAIAVGLSMIAIAILAIATGVVLPIASKKAGLDPAVLAGPVTTSVVDVAGLIIYFKIAQFFIPALHGVPTH